MNQCPQMSVSSGLLALHDYSPVSSVQGTVTHAHEGMGTECCKNRQSKKIKIKNKIKFKKTGSQGPFMASQLATLVKNLPANAGDVRDLGLAPGSGRFLE